MARTFKYKGGYWISKGDGSKREVIADGVAMGTVRSVYPNAAYPGADGNGFPIPDLVDRGWSEAHVDLCFGPVHGAAVDLSDEDIAALGQAIIGAVPSADEIAEAVADEDHRRSEA